MIIYWIYNILIKTNVVVNLYDELHIRETLTSTFIFNTIENKHQKLNILYQQKQITINMNITRNLVQLCARKSSAATSRTANTMTKQFLKNNNTIALQQRSLSSGLAQIDPAKLDVKTSDVRKILPPKEDLVFGQVFTDHLLEVDWSHDHGWHAPQIKPYGNMQIDPASSVLHYGLECFEGMKAYKGMFI